MPTDLLVRIVDSFPHSVVVTDLNARIVYVNRRFTELTGYEPYAVLGENPRILASGQTMPATYAGMWNAITQGRVWSCELLDRKRSGELYWARLTVFPLCDENGKPTHYVGHQVDISADKLGAASGAPQPAFERKQLRVHQLETGMVLRDDLRTRAGVMMLRKGHVIDDLLLQRLRHTHEAGQIFGLLSVDVPVRPP